MPTFTFQDIFKSSFLERLDAVSLPDAAIALALAFCLGSSSWSIKNATPASCTPPASG